MDAALPMEVREALGRMPAVTDAVALTLAHGLATGGLDVCEALLKEQHASAREMAVRLAAASIRLVEHLEEDWP